MEKKRAIALGFFDGVHLGHAALLRRGAEWAAQNGAVPAAITFDVHPDSLVRGADVPLINSPQDREALLRRAGMEEIITLRFDAGLMHMDWQEFVDHILLEKYHAAYVVAGYDFHFGDRGEGNAQRLRQRCQAAGVPCDIVDRVALAGETVSSTRIRELIAGGEMARARAFLGHPHILSGRVQRGKGLGKGLGFPTANLEFQPGVLLPAFGVYASMVRLDNGARHPAAVNVGVRPTVKDNSAVTAESYILDGFSENLYGRELTVEFYEFLRPERRFSSLDALTAEVMKNARQTLAYFSAGEK